jgi:CDP-diacylglycerol--serine O-phosphatidyltransferase
VIENGEGRPRRSLDLRRGVYIVPTLFTIFNLFFGFRSILNSIHAMEAMTQDRGDLAIQYFEVACISLLIAAIFDTFDGLVARGLGATSEFGKEYDSLADVVTFGAAPAVLLYAWCLHVLGNLGAGIAFMFLVGVSLRLARFNVMAGKADHRYFVGLPCPAGALTIAAIVYYAPAPVADHTFAVIMLIVTACVAFAMVSPIRYRSQKGLYVNKDRPLGLLLAIVILIGIASMWTREFFFVGAIAYLMSGPLTRLWSIAFPTPRTVATPAP